MPRLNKPAKDQCGGYRVQEAIGELRADDLKFTRITIRSAAGDGRQQQKRNGLNAAHQSELQRRIGQLVDQPTAGHLIHPCAHGREDLAVPEQAILAVAQRFEGTQADQSFERTPKRLRGFFFADFVGFRLGLILLYGWRLQKKLQNWPKETSVLADLKPRCENDYFV